MTYEKAELVLEQLMAGHRDLYLVARGGRPAIVDWLEGEEQVVGRLSARRKLFRKLCFRREAELELEVTE